MKKKWLVLVSTFLMLTLNAHMVSALAPVAEVYYHGGTSAYDASHFESQVNEAIKGKLVAAGINPKYAMIMDASANPAAVTDTTHVHAGHDSWHGFMGLTPEVETADHNHVQITNGGRTLAFYGYTNPAYKDFMLTSGTPAGKKVITFDMDESKVDYHSMEGGGFLFNSKIDGDGKLYGYAILYVQGDVRVFKINGVDADAFHNETARGLSSMSPDVTLVGTYAKGASTQHSIKIVITDKLNMWDNGTLTIEDLALDSSFGGNEFGPIVSHVSHGCHIISIFTFDNMKLFSTSDKSFEEAVQDIHWEPTAPYRYFVNINDNNDGYWDPGTGAPNAAPVSELNQDAVQYVGVTSVTYSTYTDSFIGQLSLGGLNVHSGDPVNEIVDAIASRIAADIISKKDAILAIEAAESVTDIQYAGMDSKKSVKQNLTLVQDDDPAVTTVWSSDDPSVIATDGTVTRPAIAPQAGTYVTLTATISSEGLTSEKTFTVFVAAAEPQPVHTLTATAGDGQVTLNFPALSGADADDIVVEVSEDGGTTYAPATVAGTLDAASTSATVTGLTNGAAYKFRLNVKSGFYAGISNEVQATPSKPLTTLTAKAGDRRATLTFPPLTGALDGDIVAEISTDGGTTYSPATVSGTLNAASTSATVTGLTNNTTYHIRLRIDSGEYLGVSNAVQVRPVAPSDGGPVVPPNTVAKPIVTDPSNGGLIVQEKITKSVGEDLKVTGTIMTADGQVLDLPEIEMNEDGTFNLPKLEPGEYLLTTTIIAPNGEKLAGSPGKLKVDSNGEVSLETELVDPYGIIVDTLTGQPIIGVKMSLYWADTELNRSKGKTPGTIVNLPELPDFPPNRNHNPQISSDIGEYGWMVFADGDYYFTAEKDGYVLFDSRNDPREEKFGPDSYIKDGLIHVGQTIVHFSFPMQSEVKATGEHNAYMSGYPDGSFHPERGITRAEVAAILSRLYASDSQAAAANYADVSAGHWAAEAIATATREGWMIGTGNRLFQPDRQVTRAEFSQILATLNEWDLSDSSAYADTAGHWAAKAIAMAKQNGLLFDFADTHFMPNQALTRLEAVRIFNRLLDRQPWTVDAAPLWSDVGLDHKRYTDIMEASVPHGYVLYENGYEQWQDGQEQ